MVSAIRRSSSLCAVGRRECQPVFPSVGEWLSLVEHLVRDTVEIH